MSKILVRTKGWIDTEEDDYEQRLADGCVNVWVVPDDGMHKMTDEEAKAFGLEVY